jgi:methionine sulfoxide reductase heme-binding subunit
MGKSRFTPLQIAVHIGAWIPLAWLAWAYTTDHLTINPIQAATQQTGKFAITMLVLSLACTPLNTLFRWRGVLKVRRALGLYALMYAAIHVSILVGVDYGFDLSSLWGDLAGKPYILVGTATLLILIPLGITSTKGWKKRLGRGWRQLHRLIYIASLLAVLHFAWAKKGDLFSLRGDITQPLLYGAIVILLLILRIPFIRRGISQLGDSIRAAVPAISKKSISREKRSSAGQTLPVDPNK